jgi:hypothetical protein
MGNTEAFATSNANSSATPVGDTNSNAACHRDSDSNAISPPKNFNLCCTEGN